MYLLYDEYLDDVYHMIISAHYMQQPYSMVLHPNGTRRRLPWCAKVRKERILTKILLKHTMPRALPKFAAWYYAARFIWQADIHSNLACAVLPTRRFSRITYCEVDQGAMGGNQWTANSWSYLELSGAIWSYLEPSGAVWSYLEMSGAICSYL